MSIFNEFPQTNFHELNLDWIIKNLKDLKEEWGNFSVDWPTQIEDKVNNWLTEHPEVTTTVQDGSITPVKFTEELRKQTIKEYITPEMFGAVGNGVTDDSNALRAAIKYSIDNSKKLILSQVYYVTRSLLTASDYQSAILNISGFAPANIAVYSATRCGSIKFVNGLNIFDGLELKGCIDHVIFCPVSRSLSGSIFNNCRLKGFKLESCCCANILALCHNTSCAALTSFTNNILLTVYYFAKCDSQTNFFGCIDSKIENNYINGGSELNNNHCFEWSTYESSSIINNFIDFYQTIFYPVSISQFSSILPISSGNHYQVFRYFYYRPSNCTSIFLNSDNDTFTSNDPSVSDKIAQFTRYIYIGHDNVEYVVPPYILCADEACQISISNANIEKNMTNLVFIRSGITSYPYAKAELTCNIHFTSKRTFEECVVVADKIYNGGAYKFNRIKIPFVKDLAEIPQNMNFSWSDYFIGELIKVGNTIYKFIMVDMGTYVSAQWVDVSANYI